LGKQDTGRRKIKTKTHHYAQENTNDVNKTWAILPITGGKDERNVIFMQKY
jgi:hypothetical protein